MADDRKPPILLDCTLTAVNATEGTTAYQVGADKLDGGDLLGFYLLRTSITGAAAQLTVDFYASAVAGAAGKKLGSKVLTSSSTPIFPSANGQTQKVLFDGVVPFDGDALYFNTYTDADTFTGKLTPIIRPNPGVRRTTGGTQTS